MTIFLVAPGVALGLGGGKRALWAPLPTSSSGDGAETTPASVSGIAGYWDASRTANLLSASGTMVAGWNLGVASIADASGNSRPLEVYSQAASPVAPLATPRLNGLLGGVGRNTFPPSSVSATNYVPSGQYLPIMDPDQGFQLPAVTFGAGSDWSIYLVWSRPNFRQGGTGSTAPVALVTIGGMPGRDAGQRGIGDLPDAVPDGRQRRALNRNDAAAHAFADPVLLPHGRDDGLPGWFRDAGRVWRFRSSDQCRRPADAAA